MNSNILNVYVYKLITKSTQKLEGIRDLIILL